MAPRIWWCNQGKIRKRFAHIYGSRTLWDYERRHNVVCSQIDALKRVNKYRQSVGEVKKGDIIIHYVSPRKKSFLAVSCAKEDGREHHGLDLEWPNGPSLGYGPTGWIFETEYFNFTGGGIELNQHLRRQIFELDIPVQDNPIRNNDFFVKQTGYFRPFSLEGLRLIHQADSNKRWPPFVTTLI